MQEIQEDGLSFEVHLKSLWRQTGKMPDQLDVPSCPVELRYVWGWWCQLCNTRQAGTDLCRITFVEIKAWASLYKLKLSPFEVDCLIELDSVFMRVRSMQNARRPSK